MPSQHSTLVLPWIRELNRLAIQENVNRNKVSFTLEPPM